MLSYWTLLGSRYTNNKRPCFRSTNLHFKICGYNTHNTIQHILLKCVVVGTRNNTHNTIQHILLKCVVVGTRNNTIQHILLKCVVGTRNNTHNTIQQHGGGRRSPAVACWASDHWVASSNPLQGQVSSLISPHYPRRLLGPV